MDRYTLSSTKEELVERFIIEEPAAYKPSYNIYPSRLVPVITLGGKGGFSFFYWGTPPDMARNKSLTQKLFNATTTEIETRVSYQTLLATDRCIGPADGYYCWKKVSKKSSIPYRVTRADKRPFSFAGIWEEFESVSGEMVHTFKIITTPAPSSMSHLGETVPVMFDEQQERPWLEQNTSLEDLLLLLKNPSEENLNIYSVSSRIADSKLDSIDLIQPAPAADQFGNYSLFD